MKGNRSLSGTASLGTLARGPLGGLDPSNAKLVLDGVGSNDG